MYTPTMTESQYWYLFVISWILGTLGSLFLIVSFSLLQKFRRPPFTMVFYAGCCDLASSITMMLSVIKTDAVCSVLGPLSNFFPLAGCCWTTTVTITTYYMTTDKKRPDPHDWPHFDLLSHLICWLLPLAFTLAPVISHDFSQLAYQWCWIDIRDTVHRFLCFYLLLFLTFVINIALVVRLAILDYKRSKALRQHSTSLMSDTDNHHHHNNNLTSPTLPSRIIPAGSAASSSLSSRHNSTNNTFDTARKRILRLITIYVLVFMVSRTWAVVNRVYEGMNLQDNDTLLKAVHTCFTLLQGFFDAIVFGSSPMLRREYVRMWRAHRGIPYDIDPA